MIFNPNQVTWTLRKGVKLPFAPQENIESVNNNSAERVPNSQVTNAVVNTVDAPLNQVAASFVDTSLTHNNEPSIFKVDTPASINVGPDNSSIPTEATITENVDPVSESSANNVQVTATATPTTATTSTVDPTSSHTQEALSPTAAPPANNTAPVVDGRVVDKSVLENVKESFPRWKTLPYKLRAKRADLFINLNSDVPFL